MKKLSICGNCFFILTLLGVCHETVAFFCPLTTSQEADRLQQRHRMPRAEWPSQVNPSLMAASRPSWISLEFETIKSHSE